MASVKRPRNLYPKVVAVQVMSVIRSETNVIVHPVNRHNYRPLQKHQLVAVVGGRGEQRIVAKLVIAVVWYKDQGRNIVEMVFFVDLVVSVPKPIWGVVTGNRLVGLFVNEKKWRC